MRREAFALLDALDRPGSREFDVITTLAARQLGCRMAIVSLVDATSHRFLSSFGVGGTGVPRQDSFCARVVDAEEALILSDASRDPRFCANPLVTGPPHVRFYAGIPLHVRLDGAENGRVVVGSLCVIDDVPRSLDAHGEAVLRDLASVAEALIEARSAARRVGLLVEESVAALEALKRERRRFQQAERLASLGSWRLTFDDDRVVWSDQVYAIHEIPVGTPPPLGDALNFYPPESRDLVRAAIEATIRTGEPFEFETDLVTALGHRRRVRSLGELEVANGRPVALMGIFQDVTHAHELQETLRRVAGTDELTGLANRAECNRQIDAAIASARADGTELALLLIDLDGFKAVNDRCGHLAGDDLLRRIGQRLRLPYLADAFVARLGGDEFVVVVSAPGDCEGFETLVARLLSDLKGSVPHVDGTLPVSGTIGIAWLDASVENRSDFLQRADIALYAAKKRQRGTAETFASSTRRPAKTA